ncbi:MAG: PD-(D/E)XK nuclease family protein [Culturomica sp.]|jgi:CRISPR/Cas system-associated exonuclease Cas4 (RecB family)|nr:PD-(D/E)XK nuclease family protein [Culturomica sp.]
MSSFLKLIADDLFNKFKGNFENVTIIFPNKRAGLFLAAEMAKITDKAVWLPEIMTISDFINKYSGLKQVDDLIAVTKLYKAYIKVAASNEKFDDFYFWGNMLLNDFDDIDKYLVSAKDLFKNISALKDIESDYSFLDEEQLAAIKMFWSSFNVSKFSNEKEEFLKIWSKLNDVYNLFREMLYSEQLCYEGMGIRHFCENINSYNIQGNIVFAGFNALSLSEKRIFNHFKSSGQALFYWDYDIYYAADIRHEAGRFIRENLKLFSNELGAEHFNNFKHSKKEIDYISVSSNIAQAKLIPELLEKHTINGFNDTAIVLCDERMLIPVIHSIPENIEKLNITMGYPARNTSVAALIQLLGECRKFMKEKDGSRYYYFKPVLALLNHKSLKNSAPEIVDKITAEIHKNNLIYLKAEYLVFNNLSKAIFLPTTNDTISYIIDVLKILSVSAYDAQKSADVIEKEIIFNLYTRIQSLQNTLDEENIKPEDTLYMQIIQRVINSISIPFSGEPLEELQVMGLLETRLLDFRRIIILSANEGMLPKVNPASSFIPYNIRVGFRLPTSEHQDALFSYYFYRLIQRADSVNIMYTNNSKGISSSEMSRYLFQIKYESELPINEKSFQNKFSIREKLPIEIDKTPELLSKLYKKYGDNGKILSPSALNTYIECPLKFYFRYIADIKEKEEVSEELDYRLLGNIFHECAESLYAPLGENEITSEVIDSILKDNILIDGNIRKAYQNCYNNNSKEMIENSGNNLILAIIRKYIRKMLEYDRNFTPFRMVSMEKKYEMPFEVATTEGSKQIILGGTIDRVDRNAKGVRIIDYKTGADTNVFKNGIKSLFNPENKSRNKAAFQTLLYCMIFAYNNPNEQVISPGIYSIKQMFDSQYSHHFFADGEAINDFDRYYNDYINELKGLLNAIFSCEKNFSQTKDNSKCTTCSYQIICNR